MDRVIILCALFSLAVGAAISNDGLAKTVKSENVNDGTGFYKFSFETSNGIYREETGRLVNIGEKDEHIFVEGYYSYTDPNDDIITVRYTADENGYKIIPPIPQETYSLPASVVATLLG